MYCPSTSPQPRHRLFKPAISQPAYQWAPTPQSYNPSPSASKPASVVFPSRDSALLPTPDQSAAMATHDTVMPDISNPQFSGRGKRLTVTEEECLVRLCRVHMRNYDVNNYPKSFWIEMSGLLRMETNRSYSWQSCRRRMAANIASRKSYQNTIKLGYPAPLSEMDPKICEQIDKWIATCDDKLEMERKRAELEKQKTLAVEDRQRLEVDMHRKQKQNRVLQWVCSLPDYEGFLPELTQWGELPPMVHPLNQPRTRSRSRSPRREGNTNYRQRSRSPYGSRAVGHIGPTPYLAEARRSHVRGRSITPKVDHDGDIVVEKKEPRSSPSEQLPATPALLNRQTRNVRDALPGTHGNHRPEYAPRDGPARPIQGNYRSSPITTTTDDTFERYMEETKRHAGEYVARLAIKCSKAALSMSMGKSEKHQAYNKGLELAVHDLLNDVGVAYVKMVGKIMQLEIPRAD
ncbi:hypothetical protein ASPWEDRAFT_169667 [Aspergillus wentii DTO 134E9]|uniref:Uncharacterized protein n=1 Tax=Aspergillus wentii DTO 134E9 TaxID=1073089 RepID=A0A1L9RY70_ASPWE|nr:uncharacterized protein ASPWEDRAFT_169667 [Aspergillus wentii DTO 134E9]KAI9931488.1 hypothetical protein MW887_010063 [Aspergillus wentii]OJJ39843.1 hypothetical protein ASPWEDRAFT_169667 [Aspergillus wentii DTO 134E9]